MSEWGKVPREVFTDDRLTRRDIRVFGVICNHADGRTGICRVKQSTIAEDIKTDRVGVLRSIRKLVDLGYVAVHQPAGMRRSLQYRVLTDRFSGGGQMSLFDASSAPRKGKGAPSRSGRQATSERSQAATTDVASRATTDVASEATSKEQTLVNRGPVGPAAPRTSAKGDREGAVLLDHPFGSNVVHLLPPDAVPGRGGADPTGEGLAVRLAAAAGASVNAAHPAFLNLAEPFGWIASGCDLEADIVPTIAGLAARHSGSPVRSWRYFTAAVTEARDRRLAAGAVRPVSTPARRKSVTDHLVEAMERSARGEDPFAEPDKDVIDAVAVRR